MSKETCKPPAKCYSDEFIDMFGQHNHDYRPWINSTTAQTWKVEIDTNYIKLEIHLQSTIIVGICSEHMLDGRIP